MVFAFFYGLFSLSRLLTDDLESIFRSPYLIALIELDYNLESFDIN